MWLCLQKWWVVYDRADNLTGREWEDMVMLAKDTHFHLPASVESGNLISFVSTDLARVTLVGLFVVFNSSYGIGFCFCYRQ